MWQPRGGKTNSFPLSCLSFPPHPTMKTTEFLGVAARSLVTCAVCIWAWHARAATNKVRRATSPLAGKWGKWTKRLTFRVSWHFWVNISCSNHATWSCNARQLLLLTCYHVTWRLSPNWVLRYGEVRSRLATEKPLLKISFGGENVQGRDSMDAQII